MVDFVREIEGIALNHQTHKNVLVGVRRDVEIPWHTIDLEVTLELTSLLGINLFLNFVQ